MDTLIKKLFLHLTAINVSPSTPQLHVNVHVHIHGASIHHAQIYNQVLHIRFNDIYMYIYMSI